MHCYWKGNELVENCKENFLLRESTFEKAANGNAQLRGPSRYRKEREEYISEYLLQYFRRSAWWNHLLDWVETKM